MSIHEINVQKARVHNLKNVSLVLPKNTLAVITGPSGSGKSSLAFDTIYVEGQRRYIESLSSYARQFLGQFQPPEVESITGLSPSIAIDQKTTSRNPRSTVGTITEVFDYLRVLYARVGTLYSPLSGLPVRKWTPGQMTREVLKRPAGAKVQILAPVDGVDPKNLKSEVSRLMALGFSRCRFNDGLVALADIEKAPKGGKCKMEVVVDRIVLKDDVEKRFIDSLEYALKIGGGIVVILVGDRDELMFSEHNMDPKTRAVFPDLEPRLFSFNSPLGACPKCNGLGEIKVFNRSRMIANPKASIPEGALVPLQKKSAFLRKMVESIAEQEGVDIGLPFNKLPKKFTQILFEGTDKEYTYSFTSESSHFEFKKSFPGIPQWLEKKFLESASDKVRADLETMMDIGPCPGCQGLRLNPVALATKVGDKSIMQLGQMSIAECHAHLKSLKLEGEKAIISEKLMKEILGRLRFLLDVGLTYLTLNRAANTLSGGEGQRIRLATQIGSALSGVLYVLDEPSIGLHQRDNSKLVRTLKSLRDLGNTVLVVEHDEETMREADFIVDMGPGAGLHGGEIVAAGTLKEVLKVKNSLTAQYLSGKLAIAIPKLRKTAKGKITLKGATQNNLDGLDVSFPLGVLSCITGVSGSGKSTLVHKVLVPAIRASLNGTLMEGMGQNFSGITGVEQIQSIIELDQSPIGRTPHSNPATYTGIFDDIRMIYASTPDSQVRGYKQGRFSFNVKGGRCEECEGNGVKKIEMHFLPDVFITCNECKGSRYNKETLAITYRGKNIAEVLGMSIEEGKDFFKNHTKVHRALATLFDVGLGYMKLGQSATTLSGGEAQRLKLSRELSKRPKGQCLYILDEPTTGLHFQDIKILLDAINQLIEQGHSVVIIEHNLDVIKTADHVIDLGPEGGSEGGRLVAQGTPEQVAKVKASHTGQYLAKALRP